MPDLELAENRDGETRAKEKEAQMTAGIPKATAGLQEKISKEEQNSDDSPTPATPEPEASQAVCITFPTLDFLTSKARSYSMNPDLLISPIARGDHGKEEETLLDIRYSTFNIRHCSNDDLNFESSPYL